MNSNQKQIWCPPDLTITGFTLTLTDASMLRDSIASALANLEKALTVPIESDATREVIERAVPKVRARLAAIDAAILASKKAYARQQLAKSL